MSLSRKKQERLPPIRPNRFTEICAEVEPIKRWKVFWKALYKEEWLKRKDLLAIHLCNFGSYVPMFDSPRNSSLMSCHLCLNSVAKNSILSHLYNSCDITMFWWQEIGFVQAMNLKEMLAPADISYENLRNLNWLVKTVKKVCSRRRRETPEGSLLLPLSRKQMKLALKETYPLGR